MGYNKIIIYGNNIDLYEYEKDIIRLDKGERNRTTDTDDTDLGTDGENTLSKRDSENALGKRRDNAQRSRLAFRRVVACNLDGSSKPLLVTLTYRENVTDLKVGYQHLRTFVQSLRHKFGAIFKYVAVPEFQVRGAVHFHALFWGLPARVFLLERQTREIARLWNHGYVFMKETDGNERLSHYLAKYMVKAFTDPRLKDQKSYTASKNVERPTVIKGASPAWPILDEYGADDTPVVDRTYDTEWLGRGRYRLFIISKRKEKE